MTDSPESLPESLAEEIDRLFASLRQAERLLSAGRAYGLGVGLSPRLAVEIANRHGEAATAVLSNTWRVDPKKPIGGSS